MICTKIWNSDGKIAKFFWGASSPRPPPKKTCPVYRFNSTNYDIVNQRRLFWNLCLLSFQESIVWTLIWNLTHRILEHGYFEPITSGVKFQFFGAHFTCRSRMSMRVGAFDRYTLSLRWKNMELVCRPFEFFYKPRKLRNLSIFDVSNGTIQKFLTSNFWIVSFDTSKIERFVNFRAL